ncbi:MAG: hypothetical protein M0P59_00580 [Gallionella sp.]|jgi:hypothetical protein|nr:hypothetical protein [Gallionella sp.]MCK9352636.1 hypothetical protein [Gallionella sp.]
MGNNITEPLLLIANFLESRRVASAVVLASILFFIATITGYTEMVTYEFRNVELPPYSIAIGLVIFCYASALLILFVLTWMLSLSAKAFKSVSAWLVRRYQALRSLYDNYQLTKCRITKVVSMLSPQEKAFLELFCADGVALQRMANELLPHQTYMAHYELIKNDLVIKNKADFPAECFALKAEAIPFLRKLFYGGKRPLTQIELRLDRVASSGSSGGGAIGSSRGMRR